MDGKNENNTKNNRSDFWFQRTGKVFSQIDIEEINRNLCEYISLLDKWDKAEAVQNHQNIKPSQKETGEVANG